MKNDFEVMERCILEVVQRFVLYITTISLSAVGDLGRSPAHLP